MMNETHKKLILSTQTPVLIAGEIDADEIKKALKISPEDYWQNPNATIKIEEIRELSHFLSLKPINSSYKLVIIKNADKMTLEAANAILKTLEEPPLYGKIILQTLNLQNILSTIKSRCQLLRARGKYQVLSISPNYLPQKIITLSLGERFKLAQEITTKEEAEKLIIFYLDYYHDKLLRGGNYHNLIRFLLRARDLLETNISLKLLLENVFIKLE